MARKKIEKTISEVKVKSEKAQKKLKTMTTSPVPPKKIEMLNFADAIREILNGKRLTRIAWDDATTYVFIKEDFLYIHMAGKFHQLIVSVGDLEGIDWYVLPDVDKLSN